MTDTDRPSARGEQVRFGPFQLSLARRELRRDGQLVEVGQRALDLLAALLAQAGQAVSKEQLTAAAWGRRAVEPSNLTVQVASLRRILADNGIASATSQQFIRTVPGYGYVFAAPIEREPEADGSLGSAVRPTRGAGAATSKAPAEPLTHFIGRENERRELMQLLAANRLVSLTGIGGVGKTRMTVRLWRELAESYADGVAFIDLSALTDAGQVNEAVAIALGVGDGSESADAALVKLLQASQRLLIIDNAEHLIAGVRRLLQAILAQCPGLSALVTSRESLGLPGEVVFRLPAMELPPESRDPTAGEALDYNAVQLFADRAQALLPGFRVDDGNAADVVRICRRLDGIALAIEMAVPRLEVLSPRQLAERLHDRFRAVATSRHDVLTRQRTLRAMFDWSWELLEARERRLLQLLALFAAGATLDALETLVEADGKADPSPKADTVELLAALAQKSLVVIGARASAAEAVPRFRMLETTRQYALDRLEAADRRELDRLLARHLASLFERAEAEWPVTHSAAWLERYGPEADNLRAAMRWAFDTPGENELALRLVAASFSLWWELPGLPLRESRQWHALATARIEPTTPEGVQGWLWLGQSWTDTIDGDLENYPAADRAVQLFRKVGDRIGEGAALWRAASTVMFRDHDPSDASLLARAIARLRHQPATKWHALCQVRQADLFQQQGALLPALAEYDRALVTARAMGHKYGVMVAGGNRAYLLFELGRPGEAIEALRALRRELPLGLSRPVLSLLATVLTATGDYPEARLALIESLSGTLSIGMLATIGRSFEAVALVIAQSQRHEHAARLLGFVVTLHPPDRLRFGPRRAVYERLDALLSAALPTDERARLMAEGAAWTEAEAAEAAAIILQDGH